MEAFQNEFAQYIGVSHAIGVGNGTDALELSLRGYGIGPGDLVFTVSHTAVATVAAIESTGASAVFVDVDPHSYTMDPDALEIAISSAKSGVPKCIVPVHLYGSPCDMKAVMRIANQHELIVVEDCAQSHGAEFAGKRTGSIGHAASFSFYPTKNLGTFGDGGMVVTNDGAIAERVRLLRQYGWKERYISEIGGRNSRLDEIHAAILRVRLRYLEKDNDRRQRIAEMYDSSLADAGLLLPRKRSDASHIFHQYVIRLEQRDALQAHLRNDGIGSLIHYPMPVHMQPAYAAQQPKRSTLPETEKIASQILSLPMFPQLGDDEVRRVCASILAFTQSEAY